MQRMMLIGPSQCGKTSLTQCLRGENMLLSENAGNRLVPDHH